MEEKLFDRTKHSLKIQDIVTKIQVNKESPERVGAECHLLWSWCGHLFNFCK